MSILKSYLKSSGTTQVDFATRAGMTQGNVAKLCGGNPRISLDTALTIERVTNGAVPVESWPQFSALADRQAGAA